MPSLDYDVVFLQGGIPELQGYLLSNELYWPLGLAHSSGEPPYPRMTLGWLLLAQVRVEGWRNTGLAPSQSGMVQNLRRHLDEIRSRWRTAWEKKAAQEFGSRLKLWANFLNEYRGDKGHANRYKYEVQRRTMMYLLIRETGQISQPEMELLEGMDSFLRAMLIPGEFVWDQEIANAFPRETYWYLYGSLPQK